MPAIPEISAPVAAAAHAGGALLLDVREDGELELVRIDPCVHIPLQQVPARLRELPADRMILVVCHLGSRSALAVQFLQAHGFRQAVNVAGGIDAWAELTDPPLPRY